MEVSVAEAKGQLTELVRRAEAGEETILIRQAQPAARPAPAKRAFDRMARRDPGPGRRAQRRNIREELSRVIDAFGFEVLNITPAAACRVAETSARWGKGSHPAEPNFGDCFAYQAAREHSCPLPSIGDDFRADAAAA